jgi:malate/lactate dehydrogenase
VATDASKQGSETRMTAKEEQVFFEARRSEALARTLHGDISFPAWSMVTIGGMPIREYCAFCANSECEKPRFFEEAATYVRQAAYRMIEAKGSTFYAIAEAAAVIVQAIVRDEKRILPVSTVHRDYRGLPLTAFSLPTILGEAGAERLVDVELPVEEQQRLLDSARFVASRVREAQAPPERPDRRLRPGSGRRSADTGGSSPSYR